MKYTLKLSHLVLALIVGLIGGLLTGNVSLGIALFLIVLVVVWWPIYVAYAKDNPKHLWFKRKLFGWGWTPVTWQGWLVILVYLALVVTLLYRGDLGSDPTGDTLMNVLPQFVILTAILIFICYKKGEKPRWQWGRRIED